MKDLLAPRLCRMISLLAYNDTDTVTVTVTDKNGYSESLHYKPTKGFMHERNGPNAQLGKKK